MDTVVLSVSFDDISDIDPEFAAWIEEHGLEGDAVSMLAKWVQRYVDDCPDMMSSCVEEVMTDLRYNPEN